MTEDSAESVVFIAGGAAVGAGVSATVGGMGLVGGFGGVGIGMAPVTAAGVVAGAAAYGAFKAIGDKDATALGAIGIGALGGAGVSAAVGGMGLSFSGTAVGIGMGSMAVVGGVVGLGLYGIAKLINSSDAGSNFSRNMQALAEITREYEDKRRWAALEVEEELQALKAQLHTKTDLKLDSVPSPSFNPIFTPPVNPKNSATTSAAQENQFTAPETEADVLSIQAQPPQTWQCVHILQGHFSSVNSVAFSPDGQTFATGSDNGLIDLWNLKTGQRLSTFFLALKGVSSVAFSPDGQTLVSGDFDRTITSWKVATKEMGNFYGSCGSPYSHAGYVYSVAFTPDGKTVASGSADKTVKIWDVRRLVSTRTLTGHTDTIWCVAITPDGQTLVSGSADKTIRIWRLSSWEEPRLLTGHSGWVMSVSISPDGQTLVSGSGDASIKVWNLRTGKLLRTLTGHSKAILSVAISPDGESLASASRDSTIKVWNLRNGECLQTLPGCNPIAFSRDGQTLVSGSDNYTIKVWRQIVDSQEPLLESILSGEWWEVLGVDRKAHPHVVKYAYRRLARQYHPDINRSTRAIAKMQAINNALRHSWKNWVRVGCS